MNGFDEKDLLVRELRDRSADVGGHPIGFDAVRQSARRMQRRRNVLTGTVAAVVASIALPTGLAVTGSLTTAEGPSKGTVASRPSEDPTATPTRRSDGTYPLTTTGLPRGGAPELPYVYDHAGKSELVTPRGPEPLPVAYREITEYAGGWLALRFDPEGTEMSMLDENLKVGRTFPSGESFAVSNDGSQVVYVEMQDDGSQYLVNAPTNGQDVQAWPFPGQPAVRPVGLVDRGTVVYQTEGTDDQGRSTSVVGLVTAEGETELKGFTSVADADIVHGLVAGQTKSDLLNGSCYGVMDPAVSSSEMLWDTCDYSLDGFSPDGRYLLASIPDYDGMGAPTLAVLEARTGDLVVEFSPEKDDQTVLFQRAWEDEDTVLGVALKGTVVSMLRFELDGHVEEVVDPVSVDDSMVDLPFRFGARSF